MAKREILAGATDQTIDIFIRDSSSTTGGGLTGLAYNTASLTCYYRKGATGTPTALTLATQTVGGAHSDGGFVAVDGTNCPGQYRLDLSDTIVATAGMTYVYLKGATNMAPCVVEIEVVGVNKFDAVRMGLTALPNAAADAAGGLPISDAGGLDIDTLIGRLDAAITSRMASYTQPTGFLAATFPGTVASTTNITAGVITTVTNLTNAPTAGDLTATMKMSVNAEVDTALGDYDGPTNAEMVARTIAAADYATATGVSAVETDTQDIQSRLPAALTIDGNIKADALRLGGTLQTGRDIGASVLLSNGTGTGQVKLASGYLAMTWADIAAPTTTVNLSGTTIKAVTDGVNVTQLGGSTQSATDLKDFADTGYDPVTHWAKSDIQAIGGNASGVSNLNDFVVSGYDPALHKILLVDTVTNLTNAPTAGDFTATMKTSITAAVPDTGAIAGAVGSQITSDHGAGSYERNTEPPTAAENRTEMDSNSTKLAALDSRLTSSRAGYLDNLNVGGVVASQADINALNQSASRGIILTTVGQYERPESSSTTFQIEARTYSADGAAVNADSTPTLTATGITSGSLAANLGSATNPSTGVYRWTYSVASSATLEQIRFDLSAVISSDTQTMSVHSQVVDSVAVTFTTGDRTKLEAVYDKLPSKAYITGTANADGDIQADEATGNFPGSVGSVAGAVGSVTAAVSVTGDLSATMKTSVNTEVAAALATYDGPTNAEMVARTLAAASYATPTNITAGTITTVTNLTNAPTAGDLTATMKTSVNTEVAAALATYDGPTNAEMEARTLLSASYAEPGDEMTLADSEDVYPADIGFTIDDTNSRDEYTVVWFRNGAPVTSGITVPTIQAIKRANGTDLIPSSVMTQIGSTGAYKYDATTTERTTAGEAVVVVVSATINGATRTWRKVITRDVEVV